jgi:PAS domain S-box-containing protein
MSHHSERRDHQRRAGSGRRAADAPQSIKPRVLIIEPHDDTRMLYTLVFEEAGYIVYTVANGTDALIAASQRLPDLIITEVFVPRLDGLAVMSVLRGNPNTADIPVMVVTGILHDNMPQRARDHGAAAVLGKPVSLDVLGCTADDVIRTSPPRQLVRRQLRRILLTIAKVAANNTIDQGAQLRVRTLIDRLQVAVLALDDRGRHVAASVGAQSLTGYSRSELLTMSVSELLGGAELPNLFATSAPEIVQFERRPATIREKVGHPVIVDVLITRVLPNLRAAAFSQTAERISP